MKTATTTGPPLDHNEFVKRAQEISQNKPSIFYESRREITSKINSN